MRILKPWKHDLRNWQKSAFENVQQKYEKSKDFLCVATPGAGKTIFALRVAHSLLYENKVNRVVIICPTEHLKKQWAESAYKVGIDIDPNFENKKRKETNDYRGVSITYAQVGRAPKLHKRNCESKNTLVIFDEIHHLGDDLSWGDAIKNSFFNAEYRLAISGTPFRRDNNPIPFVRYINSQSKADYVYGYSDAIVDKVCRPVYFHAFEGEMEWRVKDKIFKSTFEEALDKGKASERLRTALDSNGKWLKTVIEDADKKLNEIREVHHKDAGGLLISIDQTHARQVAKMISNLTGSTPEIVVSDDPKASKKIKTFNNSDQKWLVAVKMVSEGVDIPRLRVGVYATNIKSELFFRQAVGRFVRQQKNIPEQNAHLYIPKDLVLVDFAKQIEIEREHYINKVDYVEDIFDRDADLISQKDKLEDDEKFEAINSIATDKTQFEFDFGKAFALPEKEKKVKKKLEDYMGISNEEVPMYEVIENLKKDIQDLSRIVAMKRKDPYGRIDWNLAHREWIRIGGKAIDQETKEELERRKEWLFKQVQTR